MHPGPRLYVAVIEPVAWLRHRVQVRADRVRDLVARAGVPVRRPGHRAADAGPGGRRLEAAAVGPGGQAVQRRVNHRRAHEAAAGRAGGGRHAEADLARVQAVLQLDTGEGDQEVLGALRVDVAVAAVHRAGVVVLHVHDGQDVLHVQRELEVGHPGALHVDGLRGHGQDEARAEAALAGQGVQRLSHVGGVDPVLQVDVDAVEAVALDDGGRAAGEVARRGGVADRDGAVLAANRDDDLLAAAVQGRDVGPELRVGVAAERAGQARVDREGDLARRAGRVGEGHGHDVVLAAHVAEPLHGRAVDEVLPVTGQHVLVRAAVTAAGAARAGRRAGARAARGRGAAAPARAVVGPHVLRVVAGDVALGPPLRGPGVAVVADHGAAVVRGRGHPRRRGTGTAGAAGRAGARRGAATAAGTGEGEVVGLVGGLAVPAVHPDGQAGGAGPGGEARGQLRISAAGARSPGA